jgi:hypothetical protein
LAIIGYGYFHYGYWLLPMAIGYWLFPYAISYFPMLFPFVIGYFFWLLLILGLNFSDLRIGFSKVKY